MASNPIAPKAPLEAVEAKLLADGHFAPAFVKNEVTYFYNQLGMPADYFKLFDVDQVALHIQNLLASRIQQSDVALRHEEETSAFFATRSAVSVAQGAKKTQRGQVGAVTQLEEEIEKRYLGQVDKVYRLQAFRSNGVLDNMSNAHLRVYFLQKPEFANAAPDAKETRITELGDKTFLSQIDEKTMAVFQRVMTQAVDRLGPAIEIVEDFQTQGDVKESLLVVAHRVGSTHSYFTGIPDVYRSYQFYAARKYVEPFSNGVVIFSYFIAPLNSNEGATAATSKWKLHDIVTQIRLKHIVDDLSLHYVLPRTSLTPMLRDNTLSAQQVAYAYVAWKFAFHFMNRSSVEFSQLSKIIGSNAEAQGLLSKVRATLKSQAYNEASIYDCILQNADLVKYLYDDFSRRFRPASDKEAQAPPASPTEILAHLRRACPTDTALAVFSSFFEMNRHCLKTNFYKPTKTALSFRLAPEVLSEEYKDKPFGLFLIVGSEFRGFHVRFNDVARGGVRLVKSRFVQDYTQNLTTVFDECYGLANTQQRKNKDIPEGGSKGIVLLHTDHLDKGEVAFRKFVDSLLDLMLPDDTVKDFYGKKELIFLGPDEGTADFMDWASLHAKSRGYEYWKAFTTGKSMSRGGIPHDIFGMTTYGVRAYVEGIQRKLGLDPQQCFKLQTGGPDGDLGSNEIKLGLEKTNAVVDGSGVLFDPEGINAEELLRLANSRIMVQHFDKSKLSPKGFLVLIDDKNVTLPDGTLVENGTIFRNNFHNNPICFGEFFVPCGGRPAAVNANNCKEFLYGTGLTSDPNAKPRFKYIVEGANLFFTQEARLYLEGLGIVMFKDASANKGGVTSSSLEVLAALTLTDKEFDNMMVVQDKANPPAFYSDYVKEVQATIRNNANNEFECLWRVAEQTHRARSVLSDEISIKITNLSASIERSDTLWNNDALRRKVMKAAVPKVLQDTIGFDTVMERLPVTYARALFASHIASRFIYKYGLETPEFAFYEWVEEYVREIANSEVASPVRPIEHK